MLIPQPLGLRDWPIYYLTGPSERGGMPQHKVVDSSPASIKEHHRASYVPVMARCVASLSSPPRPSSAMACDDAELAEHAYARRTVPPPHLHYGGCFLRTRLCLYFTNVPSSPQIRAHTCPGITRRLWCGWLGASGTQDLRALRLWQSCRQWRAQPWSCMDAAPGCRLQRRFSANILTAWPGRVAQAPRAGRARAPCGPAHHVGARRRKPHGSGIG